MKTLAIIGTAISFHATAFSIYLFGRFTVIKYDVISNYNDQAVAAFEKKDLMLMPIIWGQTEDHVLPIFMWVSIFFLIFSITTLVVCFKKNQHSVI